MTTLSRFAPLAVLCLSATTALASTALEREFVFPAGRFHLVPHGAVTEVRVDGAAPSLAQGAPELPWLGELVELPPGTRVASVQVTSLATEPWAGPVRLPSAWQFPREGGSPV